MKILVIWKQNKSLPHIMFCLSKRCLNSENCIKKYCKFFFSFMGCTNYLQNFIIYFLITFRTILRVNFIRILFTNSNFRSFAKKMMRVHVRPWIISNNSPHTLCSEIQWNISTTKRAPSVQTQRRAVRFKFKKITSQFCFYPRGNDNKINILQQ